jgi:outer membrane protein assembly factor BamB
MARGRNASVLYIGVGSHVVAVQANSGEELWRTKLKTTSYVTVYREGEQLFAGAGGELFCLDPSSGSILWRNKLKGLGLGVVSFVGTDVSGIAMVAAQRAAATTAAV